MKTSKLFKNLLLSNLDFEVYSPKARKIVLLNILLYLVIVSLIYYLSYNLLVSKKYYVALMDATVLLVSLFAYFDIRITGNFYRAAYIATFTFFTLILFLVYFYKGSDFTLIWTVFLPIFAVLINGSKKGFFVVLFFYALIFYLAYDGIGQWQDGAWTKASYIRLVTANLSMIILIEFVEHSLQETHEVYKKTRELEKKYIEELKTYSITDPLTKLYNRRHLDVEFIASFEKAKHRGEYFSLCILDIDNFKEYNDTYGHLAGDEALEKIAQVLKMSMKRGSDAVFRLGGEEFCILFTSKKMEQIEQTMMRVKEEIEALEIEHKNGMHSFLTASFGVCTVESKENHNFDKMYKIADANLYTAKNSGRNCIKGFENISTFV